MLIPYFIQDFVNSHISILIEFNHQKTSPYYKDRYISTLRFTSQPNPYILISRLKAPYPLHALFNLILILFKLRHEVFNKALNFLVVLR